MPQIRTWKKMVKALVSTVPKKPVPSGPEGDGGADGGEKA